MTQYLDSEGMITRIISQLGITATATYGAKVIPDSFEDSDPWTVTLRRKDTKQRLTVPFFMGRGHNGKEPTAFDVLNCLASDAATVENTRDFSDWCAELCYDDDSRKAFATFQKVQRQTKKLKRFLGGHYDAALWGEDEEESGDE